MLKKVIKYYIHGKKIMLVDVDNDYTGRRLYTLYHFNKADIFCGT